MVPLIASAVSACAAPENPGADVVVELADRDCRAGDDCAVDLGASPIGTPRAVGLLVTNRGGAPATVQNVGITGDPSFVIEQLPPEELSPGESGALVVAWEMGAPTSILSTLLVAWSEPEGPAPVIEVDLTAAGTTTDPVVGPERCDFGDVPVGTTSERCIITITNASTREMALTDVNLGNSQVFAPAGFVALPTYVAPGDTLSIAVVATPTAPGVTTAIVSLTLDDSGVFTGLPSMRVNGI